MIEEVLLDAAASRGEVAQVESVFAHAGFQVKPEAAIEHRAAGVVPWVVMVIVGTPIIAFLRGFGEEAGRDAYGVIKAWLLALIAARRDSESPEGSIQIRDPEGTVLTVPAGAPERALDALAEIDWEANRGAYLLWDGEAEEWRGAQKGVQ